MLWMRVLSAVVGIPIALYIFYLGSTPFLISIILLTVIGQKEMLNILDKKNVYSFKFLIILSGIVLCISAYYLSQLYLTGVLILFMFIMFIMFIANFPKMSLEELGLNFLVILYPGLLFSQFILLRNISEQGFIYILLAFIITWSSDTFAYFSGRTLGKRKLAPRISPAKTIEGSIGGIIGATVVAVLFNFSYPIFPMCLAFALGIVGSVLAQLGDLIESAIKRLGNVKDSGNLIPGHGGVLDRFDSVLVLAPVFYYILVLIGY